MFKTNDIDLFVLLPGTRWPFGEATWFMLGGAWGFSALGWQARHWILGPEIMLNWGGYWAFGFSLGPVVLFYLDVQF